MLINGGSRMVKLNFLLIMSAFIGVMVWSNSSEAGDYDYKSSKRIIMKGEILHSSSNETGSAHFFTVSYKGNLYFCRKFQNNTACFD